MPPTITFQGKKWRANRYTLSSTEMLVATIPALSATVLQQVGMKQAGAQECLQYGFGYDKSDLIGYAGFESAKAAGAKIPGLVTYRNCDQYYTKTPVAYQLHTNLSGAGYVLATTTWTPSETPKLPWVGGVVGPNSRLDMQMVGDAVETPVKANCSMMLDITRYLPV